MEHVGIFYYPNHFNQVDEAPLQNRKDTSEPKINGLKKVTWHAYHMTKILHTLDFTLRNTN